MIKTIFKALGFLLFTICTQQAYANGVCKKVFLDQAVVESLKATYPLENGSHLLLIGSVSENKKHVDLTVLHVSMGDVNSKLIRQTPIAALDVKNISWSTGHSRKSGRNEAHAAVRVIDKEGHDMIWFLELIENLALIKTIKTPVHFDRFFDSPSANMLKYLDIKGNEKTIQW